MKLRLLSVLLVFLLVASVSLPAVSAGGAAPIAAAPVVVTAAPATAEMIINGVTVVMTGVAALKIAENLGKTWDNTMKGWDQLMKDTGAALDNLFNARKLIDATSSQAEAVLAFDYYTATSGSGGKKNDKLYHKAEWKNGKVKLDTKRISEKDAVKELKEGRDIFTAKKELAENLVNRVSKENHKALKLKGRPKNLKDEEIEIHGTGKGYYEHYHPEYQNTRPHCWFWRR